ncbi:lytic murein transglycosylase [Sphingomonas mesophila]|uniref:lytic murein transglycosylase n=1 Tax=Sphingomonas mesophila TaxID=2303576 RepID=UPI001F07F1D9|nr:lytic murein transglycosylase [Sphingomonas mesophila]
MSWRELLPLPRIALLAALFASTTASAQSSDPLAPLPPVPQAVAPVMPVQVYRAAPNSFEAYKLTLAARARAAGVREATIASVIPYLTVDSLAIRLDRGQPGNIANPNYTPPFAPYRRIHVTPELIRRGQANYSALWPYLSRIERQYGVPASVILAIWGKETSYGRVKGTFDVLRSLASLAYEGRRRTLFEGEFVAAMKLLDQGVPRSRLRGSYAGAMGHPQFMPTNVLKLRVDGDGDGNRDIWGSQLDGLASIANYLRDAGWRAGMLWGVPVRVPPGFDRASVRPLAPSFECPRVHARHSRPLTMREWRARGIAPLDRALREDDRATLMEPDGPTQTAYLLTDNYRAILDYNCSNFYALSVALLADGIIGR